jgi:putative ABC transport system permease protein
MALGADRRDIFGLVIRNGMGLTFAGLLLGIFAVLSAGSLLASILFGVKQADPLAFLGVSAVLLLSAFLASYIPARRAMSVDPIAALRDE